MLLRLNSPYSGCTAAMIDDTLTCDKCTTMLGHSLTATDHRQWHETETTTRLYKAVTRPLLTYLLTYLHNYYNQIVNDGVAHPLLVDVQVW